MRGILYSCPISYGMTKGIIYYTDNRLDLKIALPVQEQLRKVSRETGIPIVSASLKPMRDFGKNICLQLKPGHLTMFKEILAALEVSDADIIFFCEHDVLYHPSHFDFTPPQKDVYYYNVNWWRVHLADGFAASWEAPQVSGLCAYKNILLEHYRKKVAAVEKNGYNFGMGFEPGAHNTPESVAARDRNTLSQDTYIDDICRETWRSEYPYVDIRHGKNTSRAKEKLSPADFRNKDDAKNFHTGECPEWAKDIVAGMSSKVDVLDYILKKYNIADPGGKLPIEIPNAGRDDLAELLHELDFKTGVEVGVAGADYSKKLCETNPQMKICGIDPYGVYAGYSDYTAQKELNALYKQAKKQLAPFPNYKIMKKFSMDAVKKFEDNSLDFVYIDANHQDPYVTQDLVWWSKKVKPGGIVSGHDYFGGYKGKNRTVLFDVIGATHKYTEENNIKPWFVLGLKEKIPGFVRDHSRSWFWVKP